MRGVQQDATHAPGRWGATAIASLAALLLAFNVRGILRALRRHRLAVHPKTVPHLSASIWYERMLRKVARRGWRRAPAQTPAEFVTTILDVHLRDRVAQFTEHYEKARFAGSAEDAEKLPELYEEVVSTSRNSR